MNGPDVKIRGTAAHIAEKYMSLARDALASGDLVTAESYLQHAEHYNRIIMAAQTQFGGQPNAHQGEGPNGGGSYRNPRWNSDDEGDDDAMDSGGEIRAASGGGDIRGGGGGGGQDRERHEGNREHHARARPEPPWRQWPRDLPRAERLRSARSGSPRRDLHRPCELGVSLLLICCDVPFHGEAAAGGPTLA